MTDSNDENMEKKLGESRYARPPQVGSSSSEPQFKAEHTVASGETLSDIALKYYGSAAKDDWTAIYEANKDVIGDNPNLIKPDQVLKIPER
jgi:nucleoid-associated protein YgaU